MAETEEKWYGYITDFYITNYNYAPFIEKSIESVLNQTFKDYELIIIDDGSTDGSRSIIEKYANIARIVFQQNRGLNISNNIALHMARGRYIVRLDADDFLEPNAIEEMVSKLESDPDLGLVFPNYYLVDRDGNRIAEQKRHNFAKDVKLYDQPAHGACTMIRKKFLQQLGGYNEKYRCQDGYELWIKFSTKYKVTNIPLSLFSYRQHGNNLTSNEERILSTRMQIKDDYVDTHSEMIGQTVAIIPVRGTDPKSMSLAFLEIGGMSILQSKIETLRAARRVNKIVVVSSNEEVEALVEKLYRNCDEICFVKRHASLERMNVSLYQTAKLVLASFPEFENWTSILFASIEYPLISAQIIDDAVNSLNIFRADSLISVRPIDNSIYIHDGGGMKPIVNPLNFSKIERDEMYRFQGGIIVTNIRSLHSYEALICGNVGHIVIDQKSSYGISSKLDVRIVDFLSRLNENS